MGSLGQFPEGVCQEKFCKMYGAALEALLIIIWVLIYSPSGKCLENVGTCLKAAHVCERLISTAFSWPTNKLLGL